MDYWKNWQPYILDCTTSTLANIKSEMQGDEYVAFIVYLFENPQSPLALPGATTLYSHDSLHIVLRRGLQPQDEAFVIGFSMGTDLKCKPWHLKLFKLMAKYIYPKNYKLDDTELKVFDLGVQYAQELMKKEGRKNLHRYPFKKYQNKTIKTICSDLGITVEDLNRYREIEKKIAPKTYVSNRLYTISEQDLDADMLERETLNNK